MSEPNRVTVTIVDNDSVELPDAQNETSSGGGSLSWLLAVMLIGYRRGVGKRRDSDFPLR
ncbi:hypothetical protein ACFL2V_04035 [Pseudomonadota bacterium]